MSTTPHDTLIKAILGKPAHAATALRTILTSALCEALDFGAPRELLDALGPLVPRLTYALEDLTTVSDEAMDARITDAVVRTTWTVLRDARTSDELYEHATKLCDLLGAVHQQDLSAFGSLVHYLFRTKNADLATARRVAAILPPGAPEDIVSAYDTIKAEGRRLTLAKQLQIKFGALSDDVRARIEAAGDATLDLWTERVLFAATLDEMFAAERNS